LSPLNTFLFNNNEVMGDAAGAGLRFGLSRWERSHRTPWRMLPDVTGVLRHIESYRHLRFIWLYIYCFCSWYWVCWRLFSRRLLRWPWFIQGCESGKL
jgi:hypothetical protein